MSLFLFVVYFSVSIMVYISIRSYCLVFHRKNIMIGTYYDKRKYYTKKGEKELMHRIVKLCVRDLVWFWLLATTTTTRMRFVASFCSRFKIVNGLTTSAGPNFHRIHFDTNRLSQKPATIIIIRADSSNERTSGRMMLVLV